MPAATETQPRRRADAERNTEAILDAAIAMLADHPEAGLAQIAAAAGVTRQTVYAHFRSREALLEAVADRALRRTLDAIDDARPNEGDATEALARLVEAWWSNVADHARVLEALAAAYPTAEHIHAFHKPVLVRVARLIRRGQRSGEFTSGPSANWLATVFVALMHAAAEEVAASRMSERQAGRELVGSVSRVVGAT